MINEIIEKISEIFISKKETQYFDLEVNIHNIFSNEITQLELLKNNVLSNKNYLSISQFYFNKYSNKNVSNNDNLKQIEIFLLSQDYTDYVLENISNINIVKEALKYSNYDENTNLRIFKFFKDYQEIVNLFSLENMEYFKLYCQDNKNREVLANYIDSFIVNHKNILSLLK